MCQLLGMNCNGSATITFSLTGFAERGGRTADHVDGWGIAFYEATGCRMFHDDQPACDSPLAKFLREHPVKSRIVLAHLRKATQGPVTLANCHPFQREWLGQPWVFATNGDLRNFHPQLRGPYLPVGQTDSEQAFCWLMQELAKAHATMPAIDELNHTLRELLPQLNRHGTFNMLLSNGQALWAHGSTKLHYLLRQPPFGPVTLQDEDLTVDLAAKTTEDDRIAIVATEPLTRGEPWIPIEPGTLKVFVGGQPHC